MKLDEQIQILTAYRDGVTVQCRPAVGEEDEAWIRVTKAAHSVQPHKFNFEDYAYRIEPPRAELWIVWNVNSGCLVQTGPFESAADATKEAIKLGACTPVGCVPNQYIPVRVHTDASQA